MESKRVVVTGIGAVSPVGGTAELSWESLLRSESGIRRIEGFSAEGLSSQIAGEVRNYNIDNWVNPRDAPYMDRAIGFSSAAAKMALTDSRLLNETSQVGFDVRNRTGVFIGTALGGHNLLLNQHKIFLEQGARRVSPFVIPFGIPDMNAGYISIANGLTGPNMSIASACASGASAIGEASEVIRRGDADAMLAGGAEAIDAFTIAGFCAAKGLSNSNENPEKASCPFDANRNGFVMAEGAAVLVLERRDHAMRRGATIYAEIAGYGSCSDGYHITRPDPEGKGAARAMTEAIEGSRMTPADVDYVNAHGTSTVDGDIHETRALKFVFGGNSTMPPVSSTKSMTGHMLGAAGAFEAIVCILAIRDNIMPPTINLNNRDPACDLDYVPHIARKQSVDVAISNSFGFGGHNVALLFRRDS